MAVFKDLNAKSLEANIVNIKKRLEKHCDCGEGKELNLVGNIWSAITSRLLKIFAQLEEVGQASYQIHCEVTVELLEKIFQKHHQ